MGEAPVTTDELKDQGVPVFRDPLFRSQGKRGTYRVVDVVPRVGSVTDSHCHLHLCADPVAEAARMEYHGVTRICNVIDLSEDAPDTAARLEAWLDEGHALARAWAAEAGRAPGECRRPQLSLIVGCHPENADRWNADVAARLRAALTDPRVCAIGEAGLELYYCPETRDLQEAMFRDHIRLAREAGLPLCLHIRDGHARALEILREEGFPPAGAVLHCYNLDADTLAPWLAADCYVGFDGPLTFKNADDLRAAALTVPRDRLLVETDAPFMAPAPMRGMPCGPAHVIFTAARLAELFGAGAGGESGESGEALPGGSLPDASVPTATLAAASSPAAETLPAFCAQLNDNTARIYAAARTLEDR